MQQAVNATRMQLFTFRRRLGVAVRGHKLLKDKQDELVKIFLEKAREAHKLRQELEQELAEASHYQKMAALSADPVTTSGALMLTNTQLNLEYTQQSIFGVTSPSFQLGEAAQVDVTYPYGFVGTSGNLDQSLTRLAEAFPGLLRLTALEKAVDRLAAEVERTRRRVNALEQIMIPQLEANVRYIEMKLDEMERANIVRLMKVNEQREAKS